MTNVDLELETPLLIQIDEQTWVSPRQITAITTSSDERYTFIHLRTGEKLTIFNTNIHEVIEIIAAWARVMSLEALKKGS